MVRIMMVLPVAVLMLSFGAAKAAGADCEYDLADMSVPPRFADYQATPRPLARPASPRFASRRARLFRTVIRDAVAAGPNFAGHYTVAVWGCGASCTIAAIVDAASGRVFLPNAVSDIDGSHVSCRMPDGVQPAYNSLRFRRDSRLPTVLGAPDEDSARDGVTYSEWTGSGLKPVRFVPRAALCTSPTSSPQPSSPPLGH